jgi:hypothetical protein
MFLARTFDAIAGDDLCRPMLLHQLSFFLWAFFFLLPLDVCVYITRCAICVYLNYLNIYPGYQLFFPSSFLLFEKIIKKKDWTDWGDVSDRL